jgi:hypothetical protein
MGREEVFSETSLVMTLPLLQNDSSKIALESILGGHLL